MKNQKIKYTLLATIVGCLAISSAAADDINLRITKTDSASQTQVMAEILTNAEIEMIGARGAVQVSQIADQAQLKISKIIIKQNDEIIRLLRKIAKETN